MKKKETISHYENTFNTFGNNNFQKIPLKRVSYPQDNIASLTTINTGYTPSKHGIIGKLWKENSHLLKSYYGNSLPYIGGIMNIWNQIYQGKSLLISFSNNFQIASSTSNYDLSSSSVPSNSFTIFWDEKVIYFNHYFNNFFYIRILYLKILI